MKFSNSAILIFLLFLTVSLQFTNAKYNLFITRAEMNRTLGVLAEMNYVEDGTVNAYSTKFPYRVGTNISHIIFSWNSKIPTIKYQVRAVAETFDVLPLIHLPLEGTIPTKTETFAVEYRCAGSRSGQFFVTLFFNISWPSAADPTVFTLKQEKICASRDGRRIVEGEHDYSDSSSSSFSETTFALLANNEQVVYFGLGTIVSILCIFVLILCVYLKTKKRKNRKSTSSDAFIEETGSNRRSTPLTKEITLFDSPNAAQPFLQQPLTSTPKSCRTTPTTLPIFAAPIPSSKAPQIIFQRAQNHLDIKTALVELTADRNLFQVIPGCELEGTFGEVKWAIWRQTPFGASGDIDDEEDGISEDIAVVCKTLKASADKAHFQKFLQEALAFHNVPPHANLAQVVAAGTYGNFANLDSIKDFPLICYRHQGFGNLKKFLLQCRNSSSHAESVGGTASSRASLGPTQTLRTHELLSMGIQMLKAVSHLHKYGIIHKDIATRNCLVSEIPAKISNDRMYVQLCDNALSKDLFPNDYHCLGDNENRPLKWMAPETFKSKVHNSASDVWQFGVALWELFTCAQQPFSEIEPEEMLAELEQGIRLGQPYNCPDELYGAMYCCWQREALQRPTTGQLLKVLDDFNIQLRKYI